MRSDEWLEMITDPRTALCDPVIVSRLISANNMTNIDVQVRDKFIGCDKLVVKSVPIAWCS